MYFVTFNDILLTFMFFTMMMTKYELIRMPDLLMYFETLERRDKQVRNNNQNIIIRKNQTVFSFMTSWMVVINLSNVIPNLFKIWRH